MKAIIKYLNKQKAFSNLIMDNKVLNCANDESLAFLTFYNYVNNPKPIVLVLENLLACQNMYNKLSLMLKEKVYMYCVDEVNNFTSLATSPEMQSQRIYILNKLIEQEDIIVVTHTMAIDRLVPKKEVFNHHCISITTNEEMSLNDLIYKLVQIGYKNVLKVTQPFEFSTRGGVIDVFSINYSKPIRIEFFDTEIDSIRFFDVDSQRTVSVETKLKIIPATEFLIDSLEDKIEKIKSFAKSKIAKSKNNLQLESSVNEDINNLLSYDFNESLFKYYSFFDTYGNIAEYFEDICVYIVNEENIIDNENFIVTDFYERSLKNFEEGLSLVDLNVFNSYKDFKFNIKNIKYFDTTIANKTTDLNINKVDSFSFNLDYLYSELIQLISTHYYIYIGLDSEIHYDSLKKYFLEKNVSFNELEDNEELKEGINLSRKDLNIGLNFYDYKLYVIGENEIYKKLFKPTTSLFSRYSTSITISSVNELELGDYLVHEFYGIGIYKGIETLLNNGVHRDYLKIEYKNSDVLYLPLEQFKLVRKYVSKEGAVPKINKLGSKEWENTKKKINERVNELAEKLVNLYSLRAKNDGFAFAKDDELQEKFEQDFGYELTVDQKKVLSEIKFDMEQPYIMDRLLVGDVGFGKTEIAFIAAFKAINSGKQVALLCPTTLLARQHYLTALDRFRSFGIRIALLSRLVSEKETNQIIKDLALGKIDFVIGTHRILSSDIVFKDLGLLIVDEEHKFGVEHKEKIKEIKQNVDVLTLSATPIPRTLQMALTGVRGFSSINSPIENRMPVQTYVIRKEKNAIKEVIERELSRGGQVYYLSNRIDTLPRIALEIQQLVKNAKIAIAHGKLNVDQMEEIMQAFINNEYNILLCTTIIENGIDIPNVNTIIVDNADCFGLAQLYQIKGRVGRSNRLAYAYLMYSQNKELSEIASKRLKAIKEFTSLGSGYKVAMRDLITRGAGDLLGPEQSGFIESVGIDMYVEMLQKAINIKKNNLEESAIIEKKEKKFNHVLNIDAYVPEKYFNNDYERIDLYKQVDKVTTIEELQSLKEEIIDKTGKLPESIELLFTKKNLDLQINEDLIATYIEYESYILIRLSESINKINGIGVPLFDMCCKISNTISLKFINNHIECYIKKKGDWLKVMCEFVKQLANLKQKYEQKGK